jgi:nucleotide-binding universal stress UspA family protein
MKPMKKVMACVDAYPCALNVCNYAAWAALRLAAPLELLHVLDRHPEQAPSSDLSGSIGLGAQETLLQELSALDEKRSTLAQHDGRELLEGLLGRVREAGITAAQSRQRHGSLIDTLVELEPECSLFVLGQHHPGTPDKKLHLDHHVEQAIRAVRCPVLVVSKPYRRPTSFAVAFDGSAKGQKLLKAVASSPLLRDLLCHVVMAGKESEAAASHLAWARNFLGAAGLNGRVSLVMGETESSLMTYLKAHAVDLLVMGAFGHSRIRQFIVGSTTTTLLRSSPVPVLVLR